MPRCIGTGEERGCATSLLLRYDEGGDRRPDQPAVGYCEDVAAAKPRPTEVLSRSMNEDDDIDGLAAEYVLGTLDVDERKHVAGRRKSDVALDHAIRAWETRLGPLSDRTSGIEPPPHVFQRIT